jgi:hypothetical protein
MKLEISDQNISVDGVRNKNAQEFLHFLSFPFFFSLSLLRIPSGMVGKPVCLCVDHFWKWLCNMWLQGQNHPCNDQWNETFNYGLNKLLYYVIGVYSIAKMKHQGPRWSHKSGKYLSSICTLNALKKCSSRV